MADDTIDDIITRMRRCAPAVDAETCRRLEDELRQCYGGQRVYMRRTAPVEKKTFRLGAAIAAGLSLREAFAAAGLTRRTGYRVLMRPWRGV